MVISATALLVSFEMLKSDYRGFLSEYFGNSDIDDNVMLVT